MPSLSVSDALPDSDRPASCEQVASFYSQVTSLLDRDSSKIHWRRSILQLRKLLDLLKILCGRMRPLATRPSQAGGDASASAAPDHLDRRRGELRRPRPDRPRPGSRAPRGVPGAAAILRQG